MGHYACKCLPPRGNPTTTVNPNKSLEEIKPPSHEKPETDPVVPYIAERYFLNQPLDHKIRWIQRWRLGYGE